MYKNINIVFTLVSCYNSYINRRQGDMYMKENNKGFIATSLIYSFFLVFIAVITALVSNYVANKTIMDRFNEDVMDNLNNNKYDIFIKAYNSEIYGGQTINNLIQNGNFASNTDWWQTSSTITMSNITFAKTTVRLNASKDAYIFQNVPILNNKYYYISFEYAQDFNANLQVYFKEGSALLTSNSSNQWIRTSGIYQSTSDDSQAQFIVGKNSTEGYTKAMLTNFILINLTDNYGSGNEPKQDWLDENIDYFEGSMSYLKKEQITGESGYDIKVTAQTGYTKANVTCKGDANNWISTSSNTKITYETEGNHKVANISLSNISDDVTCTVGWE